MIISSFDIQIFRAVCGNYKPTTRLKIHWNPSSNEDEPTKTKSLQNCFVVAMELKLQTFANYMWQI